MHLPMENFFRLGLVHFSSFPYADDGAAIMESLETLAQDSDFAAVEMASLGANAIHKSASRLFTQSGMSVAFDAAPRLDASGLSACDLDDAAHRKAITALKECVDEAEALGATSVSFRSGSCPKGREMDALSRLLSATGTVCEYAATADIAVNVEVCDFDADVKALIGPSGLARSFASQMRQASPNLGLSVNMASLPFLPGTMRDKIGPIKDYIAHARIGNAVTEPGDPAFGASCVSFSHPSGALGKKELVEYLRTLVFIRFIDSDKQEKPIISLMVRPSEGEEPSRVIAGAKRLLKEAWAIA